jgi:hypothetical protein
MFGMLPRECFVHFVSVFVRHEEVPETQKADAIKEALRTVRGGSTPWPGGDEMDAAFEFTRYKLFGANRPAWLPK